MHVVIDVQLDCLWIGMSTLACILSVRAYIPGHIPRYCDIRCDNRWSHHDAIHTCAASVHPSQYVAAKQTTAMEADLEELYRGIFTLITFAL